MQPSTYFVIPLLDVRGHLPLFSAFHLGSVWAVARQCSTVGSHSSLCIISNLLQFSFLFLFNRSSNVYGSITNESMCSFSLDPPPQGARVNTGGL